MTISSARAALGSALAAMGGGTTFHVSEQIPDNINPPHAVIRRDDLLYDLVFARGADEISFNVTFYLNRVGERPNLALLDSLADPASALCVKTALEAGTVATGGTVHYFRVRRAFGEQIALWNDTPYLAGAFEIEAVI